MAAFASCHSARVSGVIWSMTQTPRRSRFEGSADRSAGVFSPDGAAIATCTLSCALCCLRFTSTSHDPFVRSALTYLIVGKSVSAAVRAKSAD